MFKKIVTHVALFCLLASFPLGCYSGKMVSRDADEEFVKHRIRRVVTFEGETIEFAGGDGGELTPDGSAIVGYELGKDRGADGQRAKVPLRVEWSNVETLYVESFSPGRTLLLVVAIFGGLLALVAVGASSGGSSGCVRMDEGAGGIDYPGGDGFCPTVYSFDGRQYVFDGAPYSGSFCAALGLTDLVHLGQLLPVDGEYRLQVGNEVEEIQHIDELKLDVVRHPCEVEVVPDARGELHSVSTRYRPISAHDASGRDLRARLKEKDFYFWEGDPAAIDAVLNPSARDTLFLSFPKPKDAEQVKVLVDGGHSLWAPELMKAYLALWGEDAGGLCGELLDSEARERFLKTLAREEIDDLTVRVRTADGWEVGGRVALGVPNGFEECAAVLDIGDVDGGLLEIALAPPAGLWRINSVSVDYSPDIALDVVEVAASSAVSNDGRDLRQALIARDGEFCVLLESGSYASLVFPVPPHEPGLETTVFARASGHYDVLGGAVGPRQDDAIERFDNEPGFAARFALDVHEKWWDEATAYVSR